MKNAFIKIRRFELLIYGATLASALIFRLALIRNSQLWSLKVS